MSSPATRPTLAELAAGPPTIDVETAAGALGVSRSALYEAIRCNDPLPFRVLHVRRRLRVVTASLIAALDTTAAGAE